MNFPSQKYTWISLFLVNTEKSIFVCQMFTISYFSLSLQISQAVAFLSSNQILERDQKVNAPSQWPRETSPREGISMEKSVPSCKCSDYFKYNSKFMQITSNWGFFSIRKKGRRSKSLILHRCWPSLVKLVGHLNLRPGRTVIFIF